MRWRNRHPYSQDERDGKTVARRSVIVDAKQSAAYETTLGEVHRRLPHVRCKSSPALYLKGIRMEQKSASVPYPCCWGCGCDFGSSKYKEDCYFYGEIHDMGATIRYCTQEEIKWGHCPCDKCNHYISKSAADRIIRGKITHEKHAHK